ncbi:MAG: hypothetical protein ACKVOR_12615 [Flavobacteriales bacterium]
MKRTTKLVIALWAMFVAHSAFSQKGTEQQLEKEANSLFSKGEYLKAFPMYSQLVSLYPNKLDYNYKFGACAIYSEADKSKAIKYLTVATSKGVEDPMAWYYLGKAYHLNYQFRESIKSYETFLRNVDPKVAAKTDAQREIETCIYGSNLLANIKDLTVINKTEADRESFFRYFNLDGIGGKILTIPDALKTNLDKKAEEPGVIHYPGNSTTIYFSSYGKDGKNGKDLYKAQVLPDGKFTTPELLKGDVNTRYDEDYCFMHSDGKTLYFASKGHNSMGGYDIFKCEWDVERNEFGPAINLDFAINTPDDDIFFIADSLNQRAYFASGRTSDQKHLHVYSVMVASTPLKIIYLKGEFISEINSEHKKATVKIQDQMSGRVVMEGSTNQQNGSYTVYVPGAGEYAFKVITENSATVHDVKVNVPAFDKPVALRQEMRLVNDGGKEKLIVTNYFDEPLSEDLAALAADMLRKKAGLDVNATPDAMAANKPATDMPSTNASSVEPTMQNAPLVAGFGDGTTVTAVVENLEKEAEGINQFVKESDKKYDNAYAYASKKQQEADATLKQAEQLRSSTSTYATQQDVEKLRQSVALADKAEALQREAQSAIVAAETVKQYKETEAERGQVLQQQATELKKAQAGNNFDQAVSILKTEQLRQTDARNGNSNTPQSDLLAKAKAKESEQQKAEQKLTSLRDDEKDLTTQLKLAEEKKATAKKKADKEQAETDYVNIKASLDGVHRDIASQSNKTTKLSDEAKDFYANAAMYDRLVADTKLGLAPGEQQKLTDTERTALGMKLNEQDRRVNALDVQDPQMLALITDAGGPAEQVVSEKPVSTRPAMAIESDHQALSSKATTAPAKRMFAASSLNETNEAIATLENKKQSAALSSQEEQELGSLNTLRITLQAEMAANTPAPIATGNEQVRATCQSIEPAYNQTLADISNAPGSEIDRTVQAMHYKEATLQKLKQARNDNAMQAATETNADALAGMAQRDQQYEAAITQLENETSDVNQYKAAYEIENKTIIESDAVFAGKLQEQVNITENYLTALGNMQTEKQEELSRTTDQVQAAALREQLADINTEKTEAEKKLGNYRNDLSLTAATNGPKADSTAVATNTTTVTTGTATNLEDEIVKNESTWDFDSPAMNEGDPQKTQAQVDTEKTEKIFKQREQSESIFAYESSAFEEIVAQHTTIATELKHREKIQSLNDEIFLIEAEMENEKSEAKLRKLDYKAEQLYLRRSLIEIDNATAIATMAQEEYEEEKKKADEMTATNQDKIDSRMMIRDHVDILERSAKSNMQEAAALREIAPSKIDDIERADFYREAFSKEAQAIDQLQQIQEINDNIDMLLTYDDQQLAMMKGGKSPDADLIAAMLKAEADVKEEAKIADSAQTQPIITNNISTTNTSTGTESTTDSTNPWDRSVATEKKSTTSEKAVPSENVVTTPTTAEAEAANTSAERIANSYEAENANASASASAGSYSAAESEAYYFSAPDVLTKDLFVTTTRAVYSENKPIPVDMEMPKGVYYKVQVGAFRNRIPQNLYDEFAPVSGETLNNGITRYTAGFFTTFENADKTKKDIRTLGYSDAFVVAFRDGKRIPLYEAMGKSAGDFQANVEKEYVYGDKGTAPKPAVNTAEKEPSATAANTTAASYYSKYPEAAKASQVETIKGLFYTVQVGVYSRPVAAKSLGYINPLNTELLDGNRIRYTSGRYTSMQGAVDKRAEAKTMGIKDAFITAYYNGKKITLSEADRLLKENGPSILATE